MRTKLLWGSTFVLVPRHLVPWQVPRSPISVRLCLLAQVLATFATGSAYHMHWVLRCVEVLLLMLQVRFTTAHACRDERDVGVARVA